jgi:hypothetical protein
VSYFVKATTPANTSEVHKFKTEEQARAWCRQDEVYDRFDHFLITTDDGHTLVTQFNAAGPLGSQISD